MSIGILGTGSQLPADVRTNDEIAGRIPDVDSDWILRKTAIRTRRYAAAHEATSDLAAGAARDALANANLPVERVDYLIVSTSTGDHPQPPTACLVQNLVGAFGAACFDVNAVCAGFVHGLVLAQSLVALRPGSHALVVGADVYSRILDFEDRGTAVLFGDGAGAVVVGEVPDDRGIVDFELASRGDAHELIRVEAGGSREPSTDRTVADGRHYFRMQGRGVTDIVMHEIPPILEKLVTRAGTSLGQVAHFVPHQANGVLLGELVRRCGLTGAQTHRTVEKYGNVGSAAVPVTLDEANRSGRLADGDLVLLAGFGGGISIGACLLRWAAPAGK
ncbi:MAG: 3-oxoacyl-ACP synthase III family protein [Actinophytocola sp.]|uniref:3-oxoacyl-ACP synthase III family protein n=1 Tax=Actinophytocola sp. TaxID=1872138 RepID=UPI003D6ABEDC